ncbi:silent information regulator 2 putative (SIR2RP1) [Leptomonas pyrrhocoris]|uniref:NAD-dependent protein deacetylase n=1 Tax=Leptomonas pyrrhocoris TaxID=157538 RepID=A0A0N0VI28_LEPPY|nr:silent information regulator 2 putative (SIR2RP1) [Leptomonas pyrrhocoris]KPA86721.1 silent information regulator 2 putative (SIR2RP1) [Leptomonas pyrrhocoris]|eukprot:XP_015665160.1 silent information regulator 2 putative (SIR2RP1) [Leptomonas pyrrhocoris]
MKLAHTEPPSAVPAAAHILGEPTIEGLARYILQSDVRRILVLVGAGASVAAGIPDFRSPDTGIYANLGKYNLDDPSDAFSLTLLRERPDIFYSIATEMNLWPGHFRPTAVHFFIRLLQEQGRLLRCCTQNIDGLEEAAGISPRLLVEAHGSFATASCIDCHAPFDIEQNKKEAMEGVVSHCLLCGGIVKPNVVFFGESLPDAFFHALQHDAPTADLVIIVGTSLQVHPFASLPFFVPTTIPRVVINRERVGGSFFRFPDDDDVPDSAEGLAATSSAASSSSSRPLLAGDGVGADSGDGHRSAAASTAPESIAATRESNEEGREEDAASSSSSSSDGYAQYGDYDVHPPLCRDVLFRGDCQDNVKKLAECLGWGAALSDFLGTSTASSEDEH